MPPNSFPAKLTRVLYERYKAYNGAADKGLVILSCELIDNTLAWQKHVLTATVTFDGTEKVSNPIDCHVTGLPYKAEPPSNTGDHPWTGDGKISWDSGSVQLGGVAGSGSQSITLNFYIPGNVNVDVATK